MIDVELMFYRRRPPTPVVLPANPMVLSPELSSSDDPKAKILAQLRDL